MLEYWCSSQLPFHFLPVQGYGRQFLKFTFGPGIPSGGGGGGGVLLMPRNQGVG